MYPIDQHRLNNVQQLAVDLASLDHGTHEQNEPMFVADLEPENENLR